MKYSFLPLLVLSAAGRGKTSAPEVVVHVSED
jgi:hypothetical protein